MERAYEWLYCPYYLPESNLRDILAHLGNIPQDVLCAKLLFANTPKMREMAKIIFGEVISKSENTKLISDTISRHKANGIHLAKKLVKTVAKPSHKGNPPVCPKRGAPKLNWKRCGYCEQSFTTVAQLKAHLREESVPLNPYHKAHITAIVDRGLTPADIRGQSLVACPSWICREELFPDPEALITHLSALGVPGFFKETNVETKVVKNGEKCVICTHREVGTLVLNCYHYVMCLQCATKMVGQNVRCPMCNIKYKGIVPF